MVRLPRATHPYLPTRVRGMFFYLYMIVDVFSRKIVGWEVQLGESGFHAAALVQKAILSDSSSTV